MFICRSMSLRHRHVARMVDNERRHFPPTQHAQITQHAHNGSKSAGGAATRAKYIAALGVQAVAPLCANKLLVARLCYFLKQFLAAIFAAILSVSL